MSINKEAKMQEIISLCKRRGFVYPSSEIYGGFSAIYDLGPYGVELANSIKKAWWKYMVQLRADIIGLDSSIIMHPKIWEASGHVSGFSDPLTECKSCHERIRVDHILKEVGIETDEKVSEEEINAIFEKNKKSLKCPNCGNSNFSDVKKFNLLVKSNIGNFTEDWTKTPVYLRGETCQGIYVNYKNILDSMRIKVPFGIAQIGKAFRNEITARQFVFRTREFEQMEMQYFTHPSAEMDEYEKLREYRWNFYTQLGLKKENLNWHKHENLVFYAKEAYDIEYKFPFGFDEVEGIHARGNYDLSQHTKYSGKDLSYTDPKTNEKYIPHIVESSVGVGRLMLAILCDAYSIEKTESGERTVLKLNKSLAPIKVAVFPLAKNNDEITKKAEGIFDQIKYSYMAEYDNSGNIGKSYRRQDEIGTPYCITIDFQTLDDNTVTIRDRDTMTQERISIQEILPYLDSKFKEDII